MERLIAFLRSWDPQHPSFPPTLLYNEGCLLRLVLDWTARNRTAGSRTHADGVCGQIAVGRSGLTDLQLAPQATQRVVLEAKLVSEPRHAPDRLSASGPRFTTSRPGS